MLIGYNILPFPFDFCDKIMKRASDLHSQLTLVLGVHRATQAKQEIQAILMTFVSAIAK